MTTHTPVRPLFGGRLKNRHIGYVCDHCGSLFTTRMNPSEPTKYVETNPGFQGRYLPNKAHAERAKRAGRKGKKK